MHYLGSECHRAFTLTGPSLEVRKDKIKPTLSFYPVPGALEVCEALGAWGSDCACSEDLCEHRDVRACALGLVDACE